MRKGSRVTLSTRLQTCPCLLMLLELYETGLRIVFISQNKKWRPSHTLYVIQLGAADSACEPGLPAVHGLSYKQLP